MAAAGRRGLTNVNLIRLQLLVRLLYLYNTLQKNEITMCLLNGVLYESKRYVHAVKYGVYWCCPGGAVCDTDSAG